MRKFKSLFLIQAALIVGLALGPVNAAPVGDPANVNIKVYQVWLSANADCSSAFRIFEDSSPTYQDMLLSPTFGNANVPNGTYQCIIIKMSDRIEGKSSVASGNCNTSDTLVQDVFRASEPASPGPDGSSISSSNGEDFPWLYFRVGGNNNGNAFDPTEGLELSSAFTVSSDRSLTFVTDFTNKIEDRGSFCEIEAPTMSVR